MTERAAPPSIFDHPVMRAKPLALYGAAAMVVGAVIGILMSGGRVDGPRQLGVGAFIGLTCFTLAIVSELALYRAYARLPERWQYGARGIVFTISGMAGFFLGVLGGSLIFYQTLPPATFMRMRLPVLISVGVGTTIGLVFYTFERLRERLAESVKRVVRSEYAEKELELARSIQQRLLPAAEIDGEGYRISARNLAARWVAGDFYDVFSLPDGSIGVAVADVAGKGMGASLIMASAKSVLPLIAATRSVELTLEELGAKLRRELGRREFVALAFVRYEPSTGRLQLANAGLPDPYLLRPGREAEAIAVPGPRLPLGLRSSVGYQSVELTLEAGDRILLLSDGLPEATLPNGEPLGYDELRRLVSRAAGSGTEWLDALFESIRSLTAPELEDDWTAVVLERRQ